MEAFSALLAVFYRYPVSSPHKGQWRGALMSSLICVWINTWVNNREAGDLIRYHAHYDVTVMANWHLFSGRQQRKHQSSSLLALCKGTPWVIGEFPSERTSYSEGGPCHGVIVGDMIYCFFCKVTRLFVICWCLLWQPLAKISGEATLKNMAAQITGNHHMNSLENDDAILDIV